MLRTTKKGFTLIELLVVVAIISILAAIAIPNMLQNTVRAKVARVKADMRTITNMIEIHGFDNGAYIPFVREGEGSLFDRVIVPMSVRLGQLTTPVSYLSSVPIDVFETVATTDGSPIIFFDTYDYADVASLVKVGSNKGSGATSGGAWRLSSAGPDRIQSYGGDVAEIGAESVINQFGVDYDPTNGTISAGDIVVAGPPVNVGQLPAIRRVGGGYREIFRGY